MLSRRRIVKEDMVKTVQVIKLDMEVHASNPRTEEREAGRLWVYGQPGLHSELEARLSYIVKAYLKNKTKQKKGRGRKFLSKITRLVNCEATIWTGVYWPWNTTFSSTLLRSTPSWLRAFTLHSIKWEEDTRLTLFFKRHSDCLCQVSKISW
jgi:hypothetical protein